MFAFDGKLVLVCVSGSIAAYKSAELVRELVRRGATVRVAMTRGGAQFVGPMTFEALTGAPVHQDVFEHADGPVDRYGPSSATDSAGGESAIQHIEISKTPDLILVAPATADLIGRVAAGLGDDVVTTSILAADAPVIFAPAMNQRMWANPLVQRNVRTLRDAGYHMVGPTSGSLACGEVGMGRMAEPEAILEEIPHLLGKRARADLSGTRVLVTLGRTEEAVDPVRYLSNRSSGKMGIAIAKAAARAGADVRVVAGVTTVPVPPDLDTVRVRTAAEMKDAVHDHFTACDVLVMVAAVADYRAATEKPHKMESGEKRPSILLEPTDDILSSLKSVRGKQVMVGFALETQAMERRAREKLKRKGLDLIVANNPLKEGAGFGTDTNRVTFVRPSGPVDALPVLSKDEVAARLIEEIGRLLKQPKTKKKAPARRADPAPARGDEGKSPRREKARPRARATRGAKKPSSSPRKRS